MTTFSAERQVAVREYADAKAGIKHKVKFEHLTDAAGNHVAQVSIKGFPDEAAVWVFLNAYGQLLSEVWKDLSPDAPMILPGGAA